MNRSASVRIWRRGARRIKRQRRATSRYDAGTLPAAGSTHGKSTSMLSPARQPCGTMISYTSPSGAVIDIEAALAAVPTDKLASALNLSALLQELTPEQLSEILSPARLLQGLAPEQLAEIFTPVRWRRRGIVTSCRKVSLDGR